MLVLKFAIDYAIPDLPEEWANARQRDLVRLQRIEAADKRRKLAEEVKERQGEMMDDVGDIRGNDGNHIEKIVFHLDNESAILREFINLNEQEKNIQLKDCFRKSKTFVYDYELSLKEKTINFKIKNIEIKRVEKAKDFDGDGGISIELPNIGFSDIAGHSKVKDRLNEIIKLLKNPEKVKRFDVDTPKGMLLYGVPGTGKTMLAKAFAKESDLPFIATTGSEILNIDFMKDIFKRAKGNC